MCVYVLSVFHESDAMMMNGVLADQHVNCATHTYTHSGMVMSQKMK